jgi:hypothetical protein
VIVVGIIVFCVVKKRRQHLQDLEKKIELNLDLDTGKDV